MKELNEYEHRAGKSRHIEVKIVCEHCGSEKWVKWSRVKNGQGRFCSLDCANFAQRKTGKNNVYFYFDKLKGRWIARWRDENRKFHVMHRSKFLYEKEYGTVPDGYDIHHIDGDITNDSLDNLELVDGYIHKQGIHGSNRKLIGKVVYKQCFHCKSFYPESSFSQSYCSTCHAEYMRSYRKR